MDVMLRASNHSPSVKGYKARAMRERAVKGIVERRWLYVLEWLQVDESTLSMDASANAVVLLLLGTSYPALRHALESHRVLTRLVTEDVNVGQCDAIFVAASAGEEQLRVLDCARRLVQSDVMRGSLPTLWLSTYSTQGVADVSSTAHAGLTGFARAVRREEALSIGVIDVDRHAAVLMAQVIVHCALRLPAGRVRGLHLHSTHEPEAVVRGASLFVARLVEPTHVRSVPFCLSIQSRGAISGLHVQVV